MKIKSVSNNGTGGTIIHSGLTGLDYNTAGHTDFQRLTHQSTVAPTGNNDGVDTAALGKTFSIGNFWYDTTADRIYKAKSVGTGTAVWTRLAEFSDISAGGKPNLEVEKNAGQFRLPVANPAPLISRTCTNVIYDEHLFDKTTEEFVLSQFQVPSDIGTGNVTFTAVGSSVTADGNEIQLDFYHAAVANTEDVDSATFTEEKSGDFTCSSTQNADDIISWTETVANLGWAANDIVYFKLSRCAIVGGTTVNGDWGLQNFKISIPRV